MIMMEIRIISNVHDDDDTDDNILFLSSWFSNDMDGTPMEEIMLALKNCKVKPFNFHPS